MNTHDNKDVEGDGEGEDGEGTIFISLKCLL